MNLCCFSLARPVMSTLNCLAFLTSGYTIYLLREGMLEMRAQMEYERAFMDQHPEIVNRQQEGVHFVIPLTFEHQVIEQLESLCRCYRSKWSPLYYTNLWSLRSYESKVETQYLRIRRLGRVPKPIEIQIIRCTEKYALIEAGDGFTGYILKLDKANLNPNLTIFNIDAKFLYKEEPRPLQATSSSFDGITDRRTLSAQSRMDVEMQ